MYIYTRAKTRYEGGYGFSCYIRIYISYHNHHQMSKLKLELEGVPKLRAFSQWMCRDKGAKFKLYDVNKGGSIDLEELELALEEYFNSVRIRPCIYTTM